MLLLSGQTRNSLCPLHDIIVSKPSFSAQSSLCLGMLNPFICPLVRLVCLERNTLAPLFVHILALSAVPNFGILMHAAAILLSLDIGLKYQSHSDTRSASWSLCAGHSTLAFRPTGSPRPPRRHPGKRRGGTRRRTARFAGMEGQSLSNTQRSAAQRTLAGKEDLETPLCQRNVPRAARNIGTTTLPNHSAITRMPTGDASTTDQL